MDSLDFIKDVREWGFSSCSYVSEEKNNSAFRDAVQDMKKGEELQIPTGEFKANKLIFNPPDFCRLNCYGTIVVDECEGSAITFGSPDKRTHGYKISELKIESKTKHYENAGIGVELMNLNNSKVDISIVSGFDRGLRIAGYNEVGSCHNNINLWGSRNRIGIDFYKENGGWANENRLRTNLHTSKAKMADEYIFINIPFENIQGNCFLEPKMQGNFDDESCVTAVYSAGHHNNFVFPRIEIHAKNLKKFIWDGDGHRVLWGYGVMGMKKKHVIDRGKDNKILGFDVDVGESDCFLKKILTFI